MEKYVVMDLEMCRCIKNTVIGTTLGSEVIQIGAVCIDENGSILDSFNTYVRPEFGRIDNYIKSLTGISYQNIKPAPSFCEAMTAFMNWIPQNATMVAWSNSDRSQIEAEATVKKCFTEAMKCFVEGCIDCQALFSQRMNSNKAYKLEDAIFMMGIDQVGMMHNGYDDAFNTALIFTKLTREEELRLNPLYLETIIDDSGEKGKGTAFTLGDLLGELSLQLG